MVKTILLLVSLSWFCQQVFAQDDPSPIDFILLEHEPSPLNLDSVKRLIIYPSMAKEAEIEGRVVVRLLISETGRYLRHIVLKDPHPILTREVERVLPSIRFSPARQAGKNVKVWVTLPFDFRLDSYPKPAPIVQKSSYDNLHDAIKSPDSTKVLELHLAPAVYFEVPELAFHFPNLEVLDMKRTGLKTVPSTIGTMRMLETLDISGNQIRSLPDELWTLPYLQFVVVNGNAFPKSVQKKLEKQHGGLLYPKDEKGRVMW